jgi:hypothetical protein
MTSRPTGGRVCPHLHREAPASGKSAPIRTRCRSTETTGHPHCDCKRRIVQLAVGRRSGETIIREEPGAERTVPLGITSGTCSASILMGRVSRVKDLPATLCSSSSQCGEVGNWGNPRTHRCGRRSRTKIANKKGRTPRPPQPSTLNCLLPDRLLIRSRNRHPDR